MQITAIELEQVVAELAEKWFGVKNDTSRQTLIRDGLTFVKEAGQTGSKFLLIKIIQLIRSILRCDIP